MAKWTKNHHAFTWAVMYFFGYRGLHYLMLGLHKTIKRIPIQQPEKWNVSGFCWCLTYLLPEGLIWSIGSIGLPPRCLSKNTVLVRWFPAPGPEIHMIYLTLRWELRDDRDDPMICYVSLGPFGGVQVQFNLMGFTTGRGTWSCKWLQRTWRDLYTYVYVCIFRNNDNIGSWFK